MKFFQRKKNPPEKTFFLGVGAQKSGTTWLQAYISGDKKVATGPVKEYHIWDALLIKQYSNFLVTDEQRSNTATHDLRWNMQHDTDRYFSFFADLMECRNAAMTFDITPEYSALPEDALRTIRSNFQKRNIRTKAIFLMRDPVERCWSAARMYLNHSKGTTAVSPDEVLWYATTTSAALRGRYDLTLRTLYRTFDTNSLYTGFYEQMFQKDKIDELSKFCNIEVRYAVTEKKFNTSPKVTELDIDTKVKIAQRYKSVYNFVAEYHPGARALWGGYEFL